MDLSIIDIGNTHEQIRAKSSRSREDSASMQDFCEIIDLSGLDLDNDETWLYEAAHEDDSQKTPSWHYEESDLTTQLPPEFRVPKLKSTKAIDTRTFTRPKKKYNRPSINDIEQMYLSGSDGNEMNSSTEEKPSPRSKVPQTVQEEQETQELTKPLQFDLSQPTSLHNFDSFMLNNCDIDSFQNMSPPSLVNSLCSSTFANLMESSFIKNDPVLREIRDKDFTETAMLQDIEAPMFQSITESCSSLNSDTPESFLKKVSRDSTFRKKMSSASDSVFLESCNNSDSPEGFLKRVTRDHTFRRNASDSNATLTADRSRGSSGKGGNATFEVPNLSGNSTSDNKNTTYPLDTTTTGGLSSQETDEPSTKSPNNGQNSFGNLNGTYRRTPKHNGTFRKSDLKNNRLSLNLTYEAARDITNDLDRDVSQSIENDMNNSNKDSADDLNSTRTKSSGKTVILRNSDSIEELKKRFSSSEGSVDLNRLSYSQEEKEVNATTTYNKEDKIGSESNRTVEIKRSSLGSADSLDRMSSLSSSSKGSTKVLSMEDVEAIVEMQERSLSQVMSTPKGPMGHHKQHLWEHNFISPIVANAKDVSSDSELSDEYKSVKSQASSKMSLDTWKKPNAKSLGYLAMNKDVKLKTNQRTSYTLAGQKPLQALPKNIRGSYSNISTLKSTTMTLGGSQQSLYRPASQPFRPPTTTTTSNLKTMGTKLKGSYTSLRPISATLPVVPPVGSTLNGTQTITRHSTASRTSMVNVTKTVTTVKMEVPPSITHQGGDSTFVKASQVSRASGLPRPTGIPRPASRIPGPRSSNIRPSTAAVSRTNH